MTSVSGVFRRGPSRSRPLSDREGRGRPAKDLKTRRWEADFGQPAEAHGPAGIQQNSRPAYRARAAPLKPRVAECSWQSTSGCNRRPWKRPPRLSPTGRSRHPRAGTRLGHRAAGEPLRCGLDKAPRCLSRRLGSATCPLRDEHPTERTKARQPAPTDCSFWVRELAHSGARLTAPQVTGVGVGGLRPTPTTQAEHRRALRAGVHHPGCPLAASAGSTTRAR